MTDNPLGYENIGKLLKDFAILSITETLAGSLYNIVDQIFIGQGVGYLGNGEPESAARTAGNGISLIRADGSPRYSMTCMVIGAAANTIHFQKSFFLPDVKESLKTCSMGIISSINQTAITFVQIILYNSLTYYGARTV